MYLNNLQCLSFSSEEDKPRRSFHLKSWHSFYEKRPFEEIRKKNLKVGPQSHNQSYITHKQKLMIKKCDLAVYMVIISLLTLGKEKLHAKYFAMNKTNA